MSYIVPRQAGRQAATVASLMLQRVSSRLDRVVKYLKSGKRRAVVKLFSEFKCFSLNSSVQASLIISTWFTIPSVGCAMFLSLAVLLPFVPKSCAHCARESFIAPCGCSAALRSVERGSLALEHSTYGPVGFLLYRVTNLKVSWPDRGGHFPEFTS